MAKCNQLTPLPFEGLTSKTTETCSHVKCRPAALSCMCCLVVWYSCLNVSDDSDLYERYSLATQTQNTNKLYKHTSRRARRALLGRIKYHKLKCVHHWSCHETTRWGIISGTPVTFCYNSGNYCQNLINHSITHPAYLMPREPKHLYFGVCNRLYIRHIHCVSKKAPTFKLSVTLSNLSRFLKILHCWIVYEICYKTHTTIPTSP